MKLRSSDQRLTQRPHLDWAQISTGKPRTAERNIETRFGCVRGSLEGPSPLLERCFFFPKRGETGPPSQRNDLKEGRTAKGDGRSWRIVICRSDSAFTTRLRLTQTISTVSHSNTRLSARVVEDEMHSHCAIPLETTGISNELFARCVCSS